jgi:DedD protein
MNEKIKHQIIGAVVLFAFLAIFIPILFKENTASKIDQFNHGGFKIPPPPEKPNVARQTFSTSTIAHVDLNTQTPMTQKISTNTIPSIRSQGIISPLVKKDPIVKRDLKRSPEVLAHTKIDTIAKAEPKIQPNSMKTLKTLIQQPIVISHSKPAASPALVQHTPVVTIKDHTKKLAKKEAIPIKNSHSPTKPTGEAWLVQLASFSDMDNAKQLSLKLQKKGFPAYTVVGKNSKGVKISRVFVGPEVKRQKAQTLQHQLAALTTIKGIIVPFDPREKIS